MKSEYPEKTTDLSQLDHIMLYRVHRALTGFDPTTLVVIGTDYIGSYKSNYLTVMTTTAPCKIVALNTITIPITISHYKYLYSNCCHELVNHFDCFCQSEF
jgi:hypothetical protein